jgi:hypothetical protein
MALLASNLPSVGSLFHGYPTLPPRREKSGRALRTGLGDGGAAGSDEYKLLSQV